MTKYVGVSKHQLMAGRSKYCTICRKELVRPPDLNHKCAEHADWHLRVVDSQLRPDPHWFGERWEE